MDMKLEQLRHDEIKSALKSVVAELQKPKPDSNAGLKEAFEKQAKAIQDFISLLSKQPKQEKPNVFVESNQDKVVISVQEMAKQINENLLSLKEAISAKPKEWNFKINRNYQGFADGITATHK